MAGSYAQFQPKGYYTSNGYVGFLPDGCRMCFPTQGEYVRKALKDYIPKDSEGLIDRLELYWESASDYLEGLESA